MATAMYCYMVSYDLADPDQSNYNNLAQDLNAMGFTRSQDSLWLKRSSIQIDVIALHSRLRARFIKSASSKLFVSRISCNDFASLNSKGIRTGRIAVKRGTVPVSVRFI